MTYVPSVTHVAITVTDLDRSTRFYSQLFGSDPVLDEDETVGEFQHTVFAISAGQLFGLHTHPGTTGASFDEKEPGLDHVAFGLSSRGELEQWSARLDD